MCGLAAILALPGHRVPVALCAQIDAALKHRGPDASGQASYLRDGTACPPDAAEIALVHRRLSIIDLDARANQPMSSADGRYVVIFNGEIYNYVELRQELTRAGHAFQTTSDTEVLIAAFVSLGRTGTQAFRRDVRVRAARSAAPRACSGARSVRHQAAVLGERQRTVRDRLGNRGAVGSPRSSARDRPGTGLSLPLNWPDRRERAYHVRRRPQSAGRQLCTRRARRAKRAADQLLDADDCAL